MDTQHTPEILQKWCESCRKMVESSTLCAQLEHTETEKKTKKYSQLGLSQIQKRSCIFYGMLLRLSCLLALFLGQRLISLPHVSRQQSKLLSCGCHCCSDTSPPFTCHLTLQISLNLLEVILRPMFRHCECSRVPDLYSSDVT